MHFHHRRSTIQHLSAIVVPEKRRKLVTGAGMGDCKKALIETEGEHVVCHAYYVEDTFAKPQYYDSDFTPQRAFRFDGVVRTSVVPPLEPSATLAHMRFTLRVRLAYPGYLRFVLDEGGDDATLCSPQAREGAPGGPLSEVDSEGYRSLTMTIVTVTRMCRVCHAQP